MFAKVSNGHLPKQGAAGITVLKAIIKFNV